MVSYGYIYMYVERGVLRGWGPEVELVITQVPAEIAEISSLSNGKDG